jgi:hypothetical protein
MKFWRSYVPADFQKHMEVPKKKLVELEKKLKEENIGRDKVEAALHGRIKELEKELQDTNIEKNEAGSALHTQREDYERKLQERDATSEKSGRYS